MIARNGNNPIPVPRPCDSPSALGMFSRDVIRAIKSLRDRKVIYNQRKIGQNDEPCPFGELTAWSDAGTPKIGIKGGAVTVGADIFSVDDREINTASDGTFYAFLDTDVVANFADDVILSGFDSATQTTLEIAGSYPSQTLPTVANSASGRSIVPLGSIVISSGAVTFNPSGCGDVILSHCPGSLTYERAYNDPFA